MTDESKVELLHINPDKPDKRQRETRYGTKRLRRMKRFLEIFVKNTCKVYISCDKANVPAAVYYEWLKAYPWFEKAVDDAEEKLKDFGENALLKLMKSGNARAIVFYNETKNKDRGYTKKQTIEHEGEIKQNFMPIKINIIRPNEAGEKKGESEKKEKEEIVDGTEAKS